MTHTKAKLGLAKDLRERRDDLAMKTRDCDALRVKVDKLWKALAALHEAS